MTRVTFDSKALKKDGLVGFLDDKKRIILDD